MTSAEQWKGDVPAEDAQGHAALGRAVQRRAAEVAAAVVAHFTTRPVDARIPSDSFCAMVRENCTMATKIIGRYFATGQGATAEEAGYLARASTALVVENSAMTDVLKNYLHWRDETLKAVQEEATALGVDSALVEEMRHLVGYSADVNMVRMVKEFDLQRRDLQVQLDDERARFEHLALHDPLTGLANRTLLLDRLRHAIAGAGRLAGHTGVVYLDLDGFKAINDTYGHATGDNLLVAVGARLLQVVRPIDTVARLGGDEFVLLCADVSGEDGLATLATRVAATFDEPFADVRGLCVHPSIGGALARTGERAEQVLARADEQMYTAKRDRTRPALALVKAAPTNEEGHDHRDR